MLHTTVSEEHPIAFLQPETAIEKSDFKKSAKQIDAHIASGFPISCLMIHVEKFEPWDDFGKLSTEFTLKDAQHEWITHIALVTDNPTGDARKDLGEHFKNARLHIYSYCEYEKALTWLNQAAAGLLDDDAEGESQAETSAVEG